MDTAKIIELHVLVHTATLTMAGHKVTESEKQTFRESLQSLVRLARTEYADNVRRDMDQAMSALTGK